MLSVPLGANVRKLLLVGLREIVPKVPSVDAGAVLWREGPVADVRRLPRMHANQVKEPCIVLKKMETAGKKTIRTSSPRLVVVKMARQSILGKPSCREVWKALWLINAPLASVYVDTYPGRKSELQMLSLQRPACPRFTGFEIVLTKEYMGSAGGGQIKQLGVGHKGESDYPSPTCRAKDPDSQIPRSQAPVHTHP